MDSPEDWAQKKQNSEKNELKMQDVEDEDSTEGDKETLGKDLR